MATDYGKCKSKACRTPMVARGKPFMGTIFGKGGHAHDTQRMSQWTVCPKCGKKGIARL